MAPLKPSAALIKSNSIVHSNVSVADSAGQLLPRILAAALDSTLSCYSGWHPSVSNKTSELIKKGHKSGKFGSQIARSIHCSTIPYLCRRLVTAWRSMGEA
jgi:hypothetical protein